jgi:hypothetical protein
MPARIAKKMLAFHPGSTILHNKEYTHDGDGYGGQGKRVSNDVTDAESPPSSSRVDVIHLAKRWRV